jgi:hypothetical protein
MVDDLQDHFVQMIESPPAITSVSEECTQLKAASDVLNYCFSRLPRILPITSHALISLPVITPLLDSTANRLVAAVT